MSLWRFLLIVAVCTLASFFAWLYIIFKMSPYSDGVSAIILFYFTGYFATFGMVFISWFALRSLIKKNNLLSKHLKPAAKGSLILTTFILFMLILQSLRFLAIWNFVLIAAISISLPIYLKSRNKNV